MGKIQRRTQGAPRFPLRDKGQPDDRTDFLLAHVTSVGAAAEILRAGRIETRLCQWLGAKLTYFFVLRPAYRNQAGGKQSEELERFPFVFVVDPATLGAPYHVYPFDTGGMLNGAFDDAASDHTPLDDYRLSPDWRGVSGQIGWAFGSRDAYYRGELRQDAAGKLPHYEWEARSFLKIAGLAMVGSNTPDQRASAIEVAFERHVPLKGHVRFAVMPRQFLEDPLGDNVPMFEALREAGIRTAFYEWQPNETPDTFRQEINGLVADFLRSEGQL